MFTHRPLAALVLAFAPFHLSVPSVSAGIEMQRRPRGDYAPRFPSFPAFRLCSVRGQGRAFRVQRRNSAMRKLRAQYDL